MKNVSLFGSDSAFVTSRRDLYPCSHYQSFPPNRFIHRVGLMEETQMYGSAAPSIYLLYLANMYFLKDK